MSDELRPSLPVEDALANAPAREGGFFVVPAGEGAVPASGLPPDAAMEGDAAAFVDEMAARLRRCFDA